MISKNKFEDRKISNINNNIKYSYNNSYITPINEENFNLCSHLLNTKEENYINKTTKNPPNTNINKDYITLYYDNNVNSSALSNTLLSLFLTIIFIFIVILIIKFI